MDKILNKPIFKFYHEAFIEFKAMDESFMILYYILMS